MDSKEPSLAITGRKQLTRNWEKSPEGRRWQKNWRLENREYMRTYGREYQRKYEQMKSQIQGVTYG